MNWIDLAVIALILGFAIVGLKQGFIYSLFKLASFFVAAFVAVKFYPLIEKILLKTSIFTKIQSSILHNLLLQKPGVDSQAKQAAADSVVNNMHLPGFFKGTIIEQMPNPSKVLPVDSVMEQISKVLATVVIDIISVVILYIIVRVALIFARTLLQGIAKLPVFKQFDKLGGFAMGAIEGLLTVYILCALLMMFSASPSFKGIFAAIDHSVLAKFFYQHNFIVDWMSMKIN